MTGQVSAQQRRAFNQVWNGAGEYGFEPLFVSLGPKGEPDLYLNTIVGCVHKWYGEEKPRALFARWAGDRRQALLDDLAWLALESAAFARETPERPMLLKLRKDHAFAFFDQEHSLSRQEWMAKNQLSYTMQTARWRLVLGRRPPLMTPREKRLAGALTCIQTDWETLSAQILLTFSRFGLFDGKNRAPAVLRLHLHGKLAGMMSRLCPSEVTYTDTVKVEHSGGAGESERGEPSARNGKFRLKQAGDADKAYMESCFGPSLLSQRERSMAEQALCCGPHSGCHIWYCAGAPAPGQAPNTESRRLAEEAQRQSLRNREAFFEGSTLYQNAIRRLSADILNCLQVHNQAEEERSRGGKLDTARVWRAPVLGDERVFTREYNATQPDFTVDLLLDGSASRLHCQELLAAQGVILSESLANCGVEVRVFAYSSLRGYTVLRRLKDYGEKSREIFRYFATGWNRDGLALRAAAALPAPRPDKKRLLLILTDAAPSDSCRISPSGDHPLGCDYADAPAVEDTAQAVRALEKQGIRVGAIFMGPGRNVPAAKKIYREHLARIRAMDELAAAAGQLIREELRALE